MWPVHRICPTERLNKLEYLVLSTMALASKPYGLAIHRRVREVVGNEKSVPLATVNLTLSRLEMKGLCRSFLSADLVIGRRPKRRYEVTAEGNAVLNHSMVVVLKLLENRPWN